MELNEIGIVFFVRDIDRSERFYRDVLGIDVERRADEVEGDWLIASLSSGVELLFFAGKVSVGQSPIVVFELNAGLIDDAVERIALQGAEIVTPVSEAPGGWSAEFRDPDGHVLSFFQSADLPRRSQPVIEDAHDELLRHVCKRRA